MKVKSSFQRVTKELNKSRKPAKLRDPFEEHRVQFDALKVALVAFDALTNATSVAAGHGSEGKMTTVIGGYRDANGYRITLRSITSDPENVKFIEELASKANVPSKLVLKNLADFFGNYRSRGI